MPNELEKLENIADELRAEFDPNYVIDSIRQQLDGLAAEIFVVGNFTNRLLVVMDRNSNSKCALVVNEGSLQEHPFTKMYDGQGLNIANSESNFSKAIIKGNILEKLRNPKIELVALYCPENFPLPRFPLGISDIAGAVREKMMGQISLSDMQLGEDVNELIEKIKKNRPDIVGISVTFGQQAKMELMMDKIFELDDYEPLIVLGGSLSALNANFLVKKYPNVIVAKGYGETTMQDIVEYWHGFRTLRDINNVIFFDSDEGEIISTDCRTNDRSSTMVPELDLLERTLGFRGVMQLETSRGCPYSCSFCPRSHKDIWSGEIERGLDKVMQAASEIFQRFPDTAKKVFLVDEEFIGYAGSQVSLERAMAICDLLSMYGFTFESSTRIDQAYSPNKGRDWHVERIKFWRYLATHGLDKMLFGMESGVDSILKRFNKKTTKEQNILAVRLLTSCDVPLRLTYITFDPLMSMDELIDSYYFQGRKDIVLCSNCQISAADIYDSVHDGKYVEEFSFGEPIYRKIPYMLVSLECLLGSDYLKTAEELGLAGEVCMQMGRRNVDYLDDRIGMMSKFSQLWIDRNFSLDYLLKSIIKVSAPDIRELIKIVRAVLKDSAYCLLGKMLAIVNNDISILVEEDEDDCGTYVENLAKKWRGALNNNQRRKVFIELLDKHFIRLMDIFGSTLSKIRDGIPETDLLLIDKHVKEWKSKKDWKLINS